MGKHFQILSNHIATLPKFGNFKHDDPYIFLTKFKQVCATIKLQQLSDDGIKLRLISFPLTITLKNGCTAYHRTRLKHGKNS